MQKYIELFEQFWDFIQRYLNGKDISANCIKECVRFLEYYHC
jgi:hypothetical protein